MEFNIHIKPKTTNEKKISLNIELKSSHFYIIHYPLALELFIIIIIIIIICI